MTGTGGFWTALLAYLINDYLISGHSSGAPLSSCNTMVPNLSQVDGHGAFPKRWSGRSPYTLRTFDHLGKSILEYKPGTSKAIRVEVRGPKFRGFMLQARTLLGRGKRVGKFVQPLPSGFKFMHCDQRHKATALTHSNSKLKRNPYFFWVPPKYSVGPVVFIATVVRTKKKYYTMITSPHMYPYSDQVQIDTRQCGVGFGCLKASFSPHKCDSTSTCDYTLRWKCNSHTVIMELYGKKSERWKTDANFVGLGWSNEAVVCTIKSDNRNRTKAEHNVTVSNYILPVEANDLYYHNQHEPMPLKMVSDMEGFLCRFERRLSSNFRKAKFVYGSYSKDGSVAQMRRIILDQEQQPFRLCRHPDISIVLPSDTASSARLQLVLCFSVLLFSLHSILLAT